MKKLLLSLLIIAISSVPQLVTAQKWEQVGNKADWESAVAMVAHKARGVAGKIRFLISIVKFTPGNSPIRPW